MKDNDLDWQFIIFVRGSNITDADSFNNRGGINSRSQDLLLFIFYKNSSTCFELVCEKSKFSIIFEEWLVNAWIGTEISSEVLLIYLCCCISDMNKIAVENICYLIFVFDKCLVFFQWGVVCLPWFLWLKKRTIRVPKFIQIFCFGFIKKICPDHFPSWGSTLIPLLLVESIICIWAIMWMDLRHCS